MELKWLIVNKHKRWFHSSRVELPFVNMSASWFLVSMYLIWTLGSKLILSNKQSRATLRVLETCLIVGLLPFMIILICERRAILLIVRRSSGSFPRRCWHWKRSAGQSASKVWKRWSKRRRETREGQTRRDRQRTDDQTHIVDGMRMEWRAHTDTLGASSWATQCDMHVIKCANCMRKMTCEVYLSTPPVGYSGSPSTVNETNCNKNKIT